MSAAAALMNFKSIIAIILLLGLIFANTVNVQQTAKPSSKQQASPNVNYSPGENAGEPESDSGTLIDGQHPMVKPLAQAMSKIPLISELSPARDDESNDEATNESNTAMGNLKKNKTGKKKGAKKNDGGFQDQELVQTEKPKQADGDNKNVELLNNTDSFNKSSSSNSSDDANLKSFMMPHEFFKMMNEPGPMKPPTTRTTKLDETLTRDSDDDDEDDDGERRKRKKKKTKKKGREKDEDDEDDKPKKKKKKEKRKGKSRDNEDEDDDRPKKKDERMSRSSGDEDDEDDRPRRRRRKNRIDDDDDDDRPRRKKKPMGRSVDDDEDDDDRGRRKRRKKPMSRSVDDDDEDDDDDRGRRRKKHSRRRDEDDDDEDEDRGRRGRRRRSRDYDEDDEPRGRKRKSRSRDDDEDDGGGRRRRKKISSRSSDPDDDDDTERVKRKHREFEGGESDSEVRYKKIEGGKSYSKKKSTNYESEDGAKESSVVSKWSSSSSSGDGDGDDDYYDDEMDDDDFDDEDDDFLEGGKNGTRRNGTRKSGTKKRNGTRSGRKKRRKRRNGTNPRRRRRRNGKGMNGTTYKLDNSSLPGNDSQDKPLQFFPFMDMFKSFMPGGGGKTPSVKDIPPPTMNAKDSDYGGYYRGGDRFGRGGGDEEESNVQAKRLQSDGSFTPPSMLGEDRSLQEARNKPSNDSENTENNSDLRTTRKPKKIKKIIKRPTTQSPSDAKDVELTFKDSPREDYDEKPYDGTRAPPVRLKSAQKSTTTSTPKVDYEKKSDKGSGISQIIYPKKGHRKRRTTKPPDDDWGDMSLQAEDPNDVETPEPESSTTVSVRGSLGSGDFETKAKRSSNNKTDQTKESYSARWRKVPGVKMPETPDWAKDKDNVNYGNVRDLVSHRHKNIHHDSDMPMIPMRSTEDDEKTTKSPNEGDMSLQAKNSNDGETPESSTTVSVRGSAESGDLETKAKRTSSNDTDQTKESYSARWRKVPGVKMPETPDWAKDKDAVNYGRVRDSVRDRHANKFDDKPMRNSEDDNSDDVETTKKLPGEGDMPLQARNPNDSGTSEPESSTTVSVRGSRESGNLETKAKRTSSNDTDETKESYSALWRKVPGVKMPETPDWAKDDVNYGKIRDSVKDRHANKFDDKPMRNSKDDNSEEASTKDKNEDKPLEARPSDFEDKPLRNEGEIVEENTTEGIKKDKKEKTKDDKKGRDKKSDEGKNRMLTQLVSTLLPLDDDGIVLDGSLERTTTWRWKQKKKGFQDIDMIDIEDNDDDEDDYSTDMKVVDPKERKRRKKKKNRKLFFKTTTEKSIVGGLDKSLKDVGGDINLMANQDYFDNDKSTEAPKDENKKRSKKPKKSDWGDDEDDDDDPDDTEDEEEDDPDVSPLPKKRRKLKRKWCIEDGDEDDDDDLELLKKPKKKMRRRKQRGKKPKWKPRRDRRRNRNKNWRRLLTTTESMMEPKSWVEEFLSSVANDAKANATDNSKNQQAKKQKELN